MMFICKTGENIDVARNILCKIMVSNSSNGIKYGNCYNKQIQHQSKKYKCCYLL